MPTGQGRPTAEMASVQDKAEVGLANEVTARRTGLGKGTDEADKDMAEADAEIASRASMAWTAWAGRPTQTR